ncbi:hypothetical protein CRE_08384 [Caenorhabditis remanei]|uniref:Uncharacterized protein n=2 Tax=Caenorhabditis remanei TaxID=31234 RepID=E3MPG6_CAERE|nr:hypothetical protein CRE_08384 [Caenorhabditis remanei]
MHPGPSVFRQMTPGDAALGADARSPLPTTPTGLLPSLHPHLSTVKKLTHRRPPRRPVVYRKCGGLNQPKGGIQEDLKAQKRFLIKLKPFEWIYKEMMGLLSL